MANDGVRSAGMRPYARCVVLLTHTSSPCPHFGYTLFTCITKCNPAHTFANAVLALVIGDPNAATLFAGGACRIHEPECEACVCVGGGALLSMHSSGLCGAH